MLDYSLIIVIELQQYFTYQLQSMLDIFHKSYSNSMSRSTITELTKNGH